MLSKPDLRRQMRQSRAALTDGERALSSSRITTHLQALFERENWLDVAIYLAKHEEANLDNFAEWLLAREVRVYAPCGEGFAQLHSLHATQPGSFGTREPCGVPVGTTANLIVLVPGLAFDAHGGRLGFGGGWYDRALAALPISRKIGIAFDGQIVDEVPREEHDIAMDALVTPSRVWEFHDTPHAAPLPRVMDSE